MRKKKNSKVESAQCHGGNRDSILTCLPFNPSLLVKIASGEHRRKFAAISPGAQSAVHPVPNQYRLNVKNIFFMHFYQPAFLIVSEFIEMFSNFEAF